MEFNEGERRSAHRREGTSMKYMAVVLLLVAAMSAQNAPSTNKGARLDIPAISREAHGAVVSIVVSDKNGHPVAQGSGFLISKDGQVVTNYHVIRNGSSAVIKFPDGAFFVVDGVLASDKDRDVAIIKAHGNDFRALTLGNSDLLQVGEEVVAIGSPLSLESTVSNGIVSAIRTVEDEGGKFLQITVPISPGSSGGPLFNMSGKVVGITTSHIKGGENLNFAIPINDVKPMLLARSPRARALPDEAEPVAADRTTGPSLENFYSAWSGVIVVDHIYAFTKGYKAKVHMARSDHTIYRFEIACLAKFADCTQLAVGGKFQIEKMLKDDPDLYPIMEDDYNLGSVRVTGSEQSAVYFVINQESAAARSDRAEEARNDEAEPSNATPTPAPGVPVRAQPNITEKVRVTVDKTYDNTATEYAAVIHGWDTDNGVLKQYTFFVICSKKFQDCHQLIAGATYWLTTMEDNDPDGYQLGAPTPTNTNGKQDKVLGSIRLTGDNQSVVYYIDSLTIKDQQGHVLGSVQVE